MIQLLIQTALLVSLIIPAQSVAQKLYADDSGEGITIRQGRKRILHFQYKPESYHGEYERAGYVHPLYGLNGEVLTEDMPEDHPYHRGIFWAWHQVLKDGKKVADGWMSEDIVWHPQQMNIQKGRGFIRLDADLHWMLITARDTALLLKEHTSITVFKVKENRRVIDFTISLYPVVGDVRLGGAENEKGYGGFCLRLRLPQNISFNSQGINIIPQENAVIAGPWMNFTGSFAGAQRPQAGIVAIAPADDKRDGYPWILRKQKSMQNIVDPGTIPVQIPDSGWHRKYRLIIHKGNLNAEKINVLTEAFNKIN